MISPWVKVDDRLPTPQEEMDEEITVAYSIDGVWYVEDILVKAAFWKAPHCRCPDYWTFAKLIAPPAFAERTGCSE